MADSSPLNSPMDAAPTTESNRRATATVAGIDRELVFFVHEHDDKHVSERIATEGTWEPFETQLICRLTRPGDLFVDCGANLGWYTVVAGALGATVVSFEPLPANAALARRNIQVNDLSERVTLHQQGLGAAPGRATLELSAFNQGDHRVSAVPSGRKATVEIEIVTLDDTLAEAAAIQTAHGRRPDIIKIDTQGSEVAILRGGRQAWTPQPARAGSASTGPVIVLEFWPYGLQQCGTSVDQLLDILAELLDARQNATQEHAKLEHATHQCFEIVEWRTGLVPLTLDDLRQMATVGGFTAAMKGFTNLLLVPNHRLDEVADLIVAP